MVDLRRFVDDLIHKLGQQPESDGSRYVQASPSQAQPQETKRTVEASDQADLEFPAADEQPAVATPQSDQSTDDATLSLPSSSAQNSQELPLPFQPSAEMPDETAGGTPSTPLSRSADLSLTSPPIPDASDPVSYPAAQSPSQEAGLQVPSQQTQPVSDLEFPSSSPSRQARQPPITQPPEPHENDFSFISSQDTETESVNLRLSQQQLTQEGALSLSNQSQLTPESELEVDQESPSESEEPSLVTETQLPPQQIASINPTYATNPSAIDEHGMFPAGFDAPRFAELVSELAVTKMAQRESEMIAAIQDELTIKMASLERRFAI